MSTIDKMYWGSVDDIAPHLPVSGYLFLAFAGIAFFFLLHIVLHFLIKVFYPGYAKLSSHDMHEYRMQVNGIVHALLASFFALYCILWTCPGDKNFFNDKECREIPRNCHVWTIFFTNGYLVSDLVLILSYLGLKTPMDKQTFTHHVVAFITYYLAFWKQDFTVTLGAAFILLEISTPFVCLRWLFFHHSLKGSIVQNCNTILLFIFFFFGRVCLQVFLIYMYASDWLSNMLFEKEGVETLYKVILIEMAIAVSINVVLNFYWAYLILLGVYRVLCKGPGADKSFTGDGDD